MPIEIIQGGGLPEMAAFIGHVLSEMSPKQAQAQLGAIFANICGNIDDEQWEAIKEAAKLPCECGDPDCKTSIDAVMNAGEKARSQFKKVQGRKTDDSEEKGFSV